VSELTYCDGYFPFCAKTKNENGEPFAEWDGETYFNYEPSGDVSKAVTVYGQGTNYPAAFTLPELAKAYWRIRELNFQISGTGRSTERRGDSVPHAFATLDIPAETGSIDQYWSESFDEDDIWTEDTSVLNAREVDLVCASDPSYAIQLEYNSISGLLSQTTVDVPYTNPATNNTFTDSSFVNYLDVAIFFLPTIFANNEFYPKILISVDAIFSDASIRFDILQ